MNTEEKLKVLKKELAEHLVRPDDTGCVVCLEVMHDGTIKLYFLQHYLTGVLFEHDVEVKFCG